MKDTWPIAAYLVVYLAAPALGALTIVAILGGSFDDAPGAAIAALLALWCVSVGAGWLAKGDE